VRIVTTYRTVRFRRAELSFHHSYVQPAQHTGKSSENDYLATSLVNYKIVLLLKVSAVILLVL